MHDRSTHRREDAVVEGLEVVLHGEGHIGLLQLSPSTADGRVDAGPIHVQRLFATPAAGCAQDHDALPTNKGEETTVMRKSGDTKEQAVGEPPTAGI